MKLNWDISDIIKLLNESTDGIPFVPYANEFIENLSKHKRDNSAANYLIALRSFTKEVGKDITFQNITSKIILNWIDRLSDTARAKQMYPTAIKAIFDAGCLKYNDYDRGIIKIANLPFKLVKIPKADEPLKRALEVSTIRRIFSVKPRTIRSEMAQDVVKLVFFLVGINTVDLYSKEISVLKFKDGKICYNRNKTMGRREDKAYTEITIPEYVKPILGKYNDQTYLTSFHKRYSDANEFNRNVNRGLKTLCKSANIEKVNTYAFRHTWATIAKNNCGVSDEEIDFCLNHTPVHKMARKYIKVDYSLIDRINQKVIDFIFKRRVKREALKTIYKRRQLPSKRKTS